MPGDLRVWGRWELLSRCALNIGSRDELATDLIRGTWYVSTDRGETYYGPFRTKRAASAWLDAALARLSGDTGDGGGEP